MVWLVVGERYNVKSKSIAFALLACSLDVVVPVPMFYNFLVNFGTKRHKEGFSDIDLLHVPCGLVPR